MAMANKYPGTCPVCVRTVAAGAGTLKRVGRKFAAVHFECTERTSGRTDYQVDRSRDRSGAYEVRTSGGTFYQNRRGRCEDAPCCGCCTF